MEETGASLSDTSIDRKRQRRPRHFKWDEQQPRPSAYIYYRKLVQDFESLEDELEDTRRARDELEATLQAHKGKVHAYERQRHEAELHEWARERERRLEELCEKQAVVNAIQKEHAELEDEEIRLQAQLEVLQEMQQQASETEAKRIRDLVHAHSSILEKQLEKGKLDVEFLTSIVTTAKRKHHGDQATNSDALHSLVDTIQQRRQDAMKEATAQFQARLLSFEKDKEDLRKKAEEIRWKKQRALQILSSNQQDVIKGFFATPRETIQETNPAVPSLELEAIVEAMKQSDDAVTRLQYIENEKQSARRTLDDALKDAARHVEAGPKRLEAIEKDMEDRQLEALRLNVVPTTHVYTAPMGYDRRWSIETYRHDQYGLVYFMRSIVFDWMERAVSIALQQPEKQVLELEVRRFDETRSKLERRRERERVAQYAAQILHVMEHELVREMAESIFNEFSYSTSSVRDVFMSEIKAVLFPTAPAKSPNRRPSNDPQRQSAVSLRWELFANTWGELRRTDLASRSFQRGVKLLLRPAEGTQQPSIAANATLQKVGETAAAAAGSSSPTKKRFGIFGAKSKGTPSEFEMTSTSQGGTVLATRAFPTANTGASTGVEEPVTLVLLQTDLAVGKLPTPENEAEMEQSLWRRVTVTSMQFASLGSHGLVTCVQLSGDGRLLAAGTLDDEIVVYSLSNSPPAVICATPQSKATSSGNRITRLCFSVCGTHILSYNQAKTAALWSLVPLDLPSGHSSDCFPSEISKHKHPALHLVKQFKPVDVFEEPSLPSEIISGAAVRVHATAPTTVSATHFFSSISMTGEPTHVLCSSNTGDIVKLLVEAKSSVSGRSVLGLHNEAEFDAPYPQDSQLKVATADGPLNTREFFRHGHRLPILFLSPLPPFGDPRGPVRLVSVDQGGRIALWAYSRASFRRFGWFEPHEIYQLDLSFTFAASTSSSSATRGDILQIQLTSDGKRLVLMAYAAAAQQKTSGGRLRFVQLDLVSAGITVVNMPMEMEFFGSIPPRFTLLRLHDSSQRRHSATGVGKRAAIRWFLALLMNNTVYFYSLQTGSPSHLPMHLDTVGTMKPGRAASKEASLQFNSIACAPVTSGIKKTQQNEADESVLVVAGEQHKQIRVYHFSLTD